MECYLKCSIMGNKVPNGNGMKNTAYYKTSIVWEHLQSLKIMILMIVN